MGKRQDRPLRTSSLQQASCHGHRYPIGSIAHPDAAPGAADVAEIVTVVAVHIRRAVVVVPAEARASAEVLTPVSRLAMPGAAALPAAGLREPLTAATWWDAT